MTQKDRIRWNSKYNDKTNDRGPAQIVQEFYRLAPRGRALDIATGTGANAFFLASKGFEVEAIDISDVALKQLAGRHTRVHPICADLDEFDITPNRYALIVNCRYLNRRLFPAIMQSMIPGGLLIFETFLKKPGIPDHKIFCQDYLLQPNELLHAFLSLQVIHYQEKNNSIPAEPDRIASLVARKNTIS